MSFKEHSKSSFAPRYYFCTRNIYEDEDESFLRLCNVTHDKKDKPSLLEIKWVQLMNLQQITITCNTLDSRYLKKSNTFTYYCLFHGSIFVLGLIQSIWVPMQYIMSKTDLIIM